MVKLLTIRLLIKSTEWLLQTKCAHFFKIENYAKSDFRNYPNCSERKHIEILEVIKLRNLTKINIVFKEMCTFFFVAPNSNIFINRKSDSIYFSRSPLKR